MRSVVEVPSRVDLDGVFGFLIPRTIRGVEIGQAGYHARAVPTADGVVGLEITRVAGGLEVHTTGTDQAAHVRVVERVRRLFDLDTDAAAVDAVLSRSPIIAPLVAARPGIRVPRALVPEESLIRAIVGQQISVAAARLAMTELSVVGEPVDVGIAGIDRLFPSAARLAEGGFELLRGPASKRRTLGTVTAALSSGELVVGVNVDRAALGAQLLAMPGIGPWTVGYLSLFALGDPDILLTGDSALRLGARRLGVEPGELLAFAEGFRPWRSYLSIHLWSAAARPPV